MLSTEIRCDQNRRKRFWHEQSEPKGQGRGVPAVIRPSPPQNSDSLEEDGGVFILGLGVSPQNVSVNYSS